MRLLPVPDGELARYVAVWNALTPGEASAEEQRARREREPRRLYLLAELDGEAIGCGYGGPSATDGVAYVEARVLPHARRHGAGSALLQALAAHARSLGCRAVRSHVDGADGGALAFAARRGFAETGRQVEQVLFLDGPLPPPEPPAGVELVSVEERPELLREAHELALVGYADMATAQPVSISLEEWLAEEATLPGGSFAALADGAIVGYSGLLDRGGGVAEDGLTAVDPAWRRRGVATVLKRAELAWASRHGIREVVTWTQRGNDGMRAVNERLGYVYRSVSVDVAAPLPLAAPAAHVI
jgi:mycothiol synthase